MADRSKSQGTKCQDPALPEEQQTARKDIIGAGQAAREGEVELVVFGHEEGERVVGGPPLQSGQVQTRGIPVASQNVRIHHHSNGSIQTRSEIFVGIANIRPQTFGNPATALVKERPNDIIFFISKC